MSSSGGQSSLLVPELEPSLTEVDQPWPRRTSQKSIDAGGGSLYSMLIATLAFDSFIVNGWLIRFHDPLHWGCELSLSKPSRRGASKGMVTLEG